MDEHLRSLHSDGRINAVKGNIACSVTGEIRQVQRSAKLLMAEKIEFFTVTVEEIEDCRKADGFSKTIALGQTLWFVAQCVARRVQHLDLTLVELLTLSLAVLNGVMYFLWWNKPMDVRYPIRVYLLDKLNEPNEPYLGSFREFQVLLSLRQLVDDS